MRTSEKTVKLLGRITEVIDTYERPNGNPEPKKRTRCSLGFAGWLRVAPLVPSWCLDGDERSRQHGKTGEVMTTHTTF
jgi:hypothetical protein